MTPCIEHVQIITWRKTLYWTLFIFSPYPQTQHIVAGYDITMGKPGQHKSLFGYCFEELKGPVSNLIKIILGEH